MEQIRTKSIICGVIVEKPLWLSSAKRPKIQRCTLTGPMWVMVSQWVTLDFKQENN
jgi:hypothetical protein